MVAPDLGRTGRISELLSRSHYEVIPRGIEEQVLEHVPRDVTVTVTASPTRAWATLALTGSLARQGYAVVHLSARLVADGTEAEEIAGRRGGRGARRVRRAGDARSRGGSFHGAIDLLGALCDELAGLPGGWGSPATRRAIRSSTTR